MDRNENVSSQKIRLVMVTASFSVNGISTVIMNYCRHMNLNRFDITIMVGAPVDIEYKRECDLTGISLIELPPKKKSPKEYYRSLWRELAAGYDIIHVHGNSTIIAIDLLLAYLRGIKIRIAHCHNTTCDHIYLHKLLKPLFNCLYTERFACSLLAGKWLFGGKKVYIIPNGYDTERFRFNEKYRQEIREKLKIEDKFLIGHIGRFNEQKNQIFILKIFENIAKINTEAYLILVGNGPDFEKINQMASKHLYRERIIIYGETMETEKMYAAMDVFIFPSRYEGLPVTLLEAQTSGLPCIVSDKVTCEVNFGDLCWKSIEDAPEEWARAALAEAPKTVSRYAYYDFLKDKIEKYEIKNAAKHLEDRYLAAYQNMNSQ